jgi:ribosomal 50S subunit-associated protein YjgA (DUF615 family)
VADTAYQVTNFAYQGAGQFAYQGSTDDIAVSAGGVKRKPRVIRLRDEESREKLAEFIKGELLRQFPELNPPVAQPRPTQARARVSSEDVSRAMELERTEETRKRIIATNNAIISAILASYEDDA